MNSQDPKPTIQRSDSFPKTTTMPENWNGDHILAMGTNIPVTAGEQSAERNTPQVSDETLFTRRLDPFPKPNTIPEGWDLSSLGVE